MAKDIEKKEEVVKVAEKVTVYATAKTKHYNEGEAFEVHPILAKNLIKAGKATEKAGKLRMLLIDKTYFKGELSLPNTPIKRSDMANYGVAEALQSVGESDLDVFVNKYVIDYLIRLFGRELTETFLTEIAKETPDTIWSNLKKQLLIEIGPYKASPLANYVYYWLMRDARTKTTQGGEASPRFDNAYTANNNQKMVKAWNDMAGMTCIIHKWYCKHITVYKDYMKCQTGRNVCGITQHINIYNL